MEAALKAISTARRREILRLVWDRELAAGQIASHFDVTWAAVSQQLRVLRQAGLVRERRAGRRRLYRADRMALRPLETVIRAMWRSDLERSGNWPRTSSGSGGSDEREANEQGRRDRHRARTADRGGSRDRFLVPRRAGALSPVDGRGGEARSSPRRLVHGSGERCSGGPGRIRG